MKKYIFASVVLFVGAVVYWLVAPLFVTRVSNDVIPTTSTALEQDSSSPSAAIAFPITDTAGHPASGNIRVIETADNTVVRYESYNGTNGPDLLVYLAKDLEATEFVSLGRSKGNRGNANYTVPSDVDVSEYKYVMTWCRAFGVLFDYAEIN